MPNPDPLKLVTDTTFVQWPKYMHPGHCFLWQMRGGAFFYSIVLDTPDPLVEVGYRRTRTYGLPFPIGREAYVPQNVAHILLSREQMDLARKLGWPSDDASMWKIYSVQTN